MTLFFKTCLVALLCLILCVHFGGTVDERGKLWGGRYGGEQ